MLLEELREQVCRANKELEKRGVVLYTWGNVSAVDREQGLVAIKPSGVPYEDLTAESIVVVDLEGRQVDGNLRPSSDTPTHLWLYRHFPEIGGVVHTHSVHAAAFAQAGMDIPALGTTHADYFYGDIPCTRSLTAAETEERYEENTGKVITETFAERRLDYRSMPAVLIRNHGPFTWGKDGEEAVYHAVVLETVAAMAEETLKLNPNARMPGYISEKHYRRKHGPDAYYGQK